MANIYEITGNYLQVQELIEQGELDAEMLQDTLEAIEGEIEVKADGYAKIMKNLQKDIDGLKAEEKRIADRRKAIENHIKSLKLNLESAMIATGKKKFKTDLFGFGIQKNPASLAIEEGTEIPADFIKVVESVDKTALKKAVKDGLEIDGVSLVQTESLRIR